MNKFWNNYPIIKEDLDVVVNIIKQNIKCREKSIENGLNDLVESGGKLLRPAFLLLSARFGNFNKDKLYPLAAVIEMLHMATLVHDDIVDEAKLRRGNETIQNKYGKDYAVFMGDYLFTRCFMLLSDNSSMENMKKISEVISKICIGEIEQYSSRYNTDVSLKKYLRRISAKTAALFALSFYIGAHESQCDEKICKTLGKVGYNIGMAFQIIDDILDYEGDKVKVGKPVGNDIKQGIFTLPLIFALKNNDNKISSILNKKVYTDDIIKEIVSYTKNSVGMEKARYLAQKYTNRAFEKLSTLPDTEYKQILMDVTKKLLIREY